MCDLIGLIPSTREVEENNWIIDDKTPFLKCLNTNKELKSTRTISKSTQTTGIFIAE